MKKYKKIQRFLLILIIIALIAFVMTVINYKKIQKLETEEVAVATVDSSKKETDSQEITNTQEGEDTIEAQDDTSWDEPNEEDTKVKIEEKDKKNNASKYYIKINYTANCVTVYTKDSSGNYTVPVKALICSTGKATPTSGVYKMSQKYRWHTLNGGVQGQYCTRITGHILFHSVPYASKSADSLKYVAYDKLGTKASAGCIRLTVEGALWIYNNCPSGTYVEFYSSSNPGPLGKPTAQKISSNVQCRGWDPTDPDPRNPWKNYVEPVSAPTQVTEEKKPEIKNEEPKKEEEQSKPIENPTEEKDKKEEEEPKKEDKDEKDEKTEETELVEENKKEN